MKFLVLSTLIFILLIVSPVYASSPQHSVTILSVQIDGSHGVAKVKVDTKIFTFYAAVSPSQIKIAKMSEQDTNSVTSDATLFFGASYEQPFQITLEILLTRGGLEFTILLKSLST
jgi:hypothetical protein